MRLRKYVVSVMIVSAAALMYVHQQVEIIKMGYEINSNEKRLKEVIDRKEILSYNISNLESPSRLENALFSRKVAVVLPKNKEVVVAARRSPGINRGRPVNISGLGERTFFIKFMDLIFGRAEAHAGEN